MKRDIKRQKLNEARNAPGLVARINEANAAALQRRTKMMLPAPQVWQFCPACMPHCRVVTEIARAAAAGTHPCLALPMRCCPSALALSTPLLTLCPPPAPLLLLQVSEAELEAIARMGDGGGLEAALAAAGAGGDATRQLLGEYSTPAR